MKTDSFRNTIQRGVLKCFVYSNKQLNVAAVTHFEQDTFVAFIFNIIIIIFVLNT